MNRNVWRRSSFSNQAIFFESFAVRVRLSQLFHMKIKETLNEK